MPIENYTYIGSLDPNMPASSDGIIEADDHIRGIKKVLRQTFPNITGPITVTSQQLNSVIPVGSIVDWYGEASAVPAGWAIANGSVVQRSDGTGSITTPNLTNRIVVAAGDLYAQGATGGVNTVTGYTAPSGTHIHGATAAVAGAHTHGGSTGSTALTVDQLPPHDHPIRTSDGVSSTTGVLTGPAGTTSPTRATETRGQGQGHTHSIASDGVHSHTVIVNPVGDHVHGITVDVRQPYYALYKIMKV